MHTLADAQRALLSTVLLELRLIAGWLPSDALGLIRTLAGWYELVNLEDRIAYLGGAPLRPPFELGSLDVAWSAASGAQSLGELRSALARSSWAIPEARRRPSSVSGSDWPGRAESPPASRRRRAGQRERPRCSSHASSSSPGCRSTRCRCPTSDSWALPGRPPARTSGSSKPCQPRPRGRLRPQPISDLLWRAEASWWTRVEQEARVLLGSAVAGRNVVVGAAALLAADARRVAVALGAVTRRGLPGVEEVLDATA